MSFSPLFRLRRGFAAALVLTLAGLAPVITSGGAVPAGAADARPSRGYWMVASDGGIFAYGGARFLGSTGAIKLNMPIVGMAATPSGDGYWLVASDGGIFSFGDAGFFGSTGAIKLNKPIVGMAATPSGKGYWMVASDGGIFAFGDARFVGSTGAIKLNKPITGMTPSATGRGYRMVATDGGIFSFGDAAYFGSAAGTALAKPISGMAPTPSGKGYWLAGSDGRIFPYGDAADLGAATSLRSVAGVAPTPTGAGYWAVAADGALAAFGDAVDLGHPSGALTRPIVGMAVLPATAVAPGSPGAPGVTPPIPGTDGSPTTTVTTTPFVSDLTRLYSSQALGGTVGTPPQLELDPSHPFRHVCDRPPCNISNANYAEEIRAIARVGDRLFIGGFFHGLVDPASGYPGTKIAGTSFLAELDARTGQPAADQTFTRNASPDLTVESMAFDGRRLYIGGRFKNAGGRSAPGIAALDLQTGLADPTFNPPAQNGSVHAIALFGARLFMGGSFKEVAGDAKYASVAALNVTDGSLIRSFVAPPFSGSFIDRAGTPTAGEAGAVNVLAVPAGGEFLMVGGEFVHVGADAPTTDYDPHSGFAALRTSDGSLPSWRPHNDRPVFGIALSPDGRTIYTAMGGQGGALGAFRPGQDEPIFDFSPPNPQGNVNGHRALDWRLAHVDGDALGVAATDTRIYLGGHFDVAQPDPDAPCLHQVPSMCKGAPGATPHRHLVAFDLNGNEDPTWTAQADTPEGPTTMLAGPDALYLGGNMKNTLSKYLDPKTATFHPGFALFPAIP
jgi:hypothetical protein